MTTPELDRDGYPTEETLKALRDWKLTDAAGALDFLAAAWRWPEFGVSRTLSRHEGLVADVRMADRVLRLATGGWSGNEELLRAFAGEGRLIYSATWRLSAAGGLHIFRYPRA